MPSLCTRDAAKIYGKCKTFWMEGVNKLAGKHICMGKCELAHRNRGEVNVHL